MNDEATWGIWCRVSGGVTGTREAWLKRGGTVWTGTQQQAEAEAKYLHASAQKREGLASYSYKARQF